MADNVGYTAGTGTNIATDEIGGNHYQRIKPTFGADGTATDVSNANPLPVTDANATAQISAVYNRLSEPTVTNPLPVESATPVRQVPAKQWNVGFAQVTGATGGLDTTGFVLRGQTGSMTHGQTGGNLVVETGTTANSEILLKGNRTFTASWLTRARVTLSQRIANQNFAFLLADTVQEDCNVTINSATSITVATTSSLFTATSVGQGIFVGNIQGANGVPGRYVIAAVNPGVSIDLTVSGWPASGTCTADLFGFNYVWTRYAGTTATSADFDSQRRGWRSGDTVLTTNTTASPGHIMQMACDTRTITASDVLAGIGSAPVVGSRGSRLENIPDDGVELKPYLWAWNGSTAPASTTTLTIGFVSIEDLNNVSTYISGFRSNGNANTLPVAPISLPALVAGSTLIGDVGIQYRASATGAATLANVNCPATPAAQQIKGSAGKLVSYCLTNTSDSDRWLKIFNALSASVTPGTTSALAEIGIKAGQTIGFTNEGGAGFATGITVMITGGQGLTNNTAVTLGDVTGFVTFA